MSNQAWSVEVKPIESRGGRNLCHIIGPFNACIYDDWRLSQAGFSSAQIDAAVNLIAAAPELLEACRLAFEYVESRAPGVAAELSAAIFKATGGAS